MRALVAAVIVCLAATPAHADEPTPTAPPTPFVTATAVPATTQVGATVTLNATALPNTVVTVDSELNGVWTSFGQIGTDATGAVSMLWTPTEAGIYLLHVRIPDGPEAVATLTVNPATTELSLTPARSKVTSETPVGLSSSLRLWSGIPWAGTLQYEYKPWKGAWRTLEHSDTAHTTHRPWKRTSYRVRYPGSSNALSNASSVITVATTPVRRPVRRHRGFAEPIRKHRKPDRPAPVGEGANASVRHIPDRVFKHMRGTSWQPGCVPRKGLRYVTVNYWGFDGYRYRGEIVVNASIATAVADIFTDFYRIRYPIRQMRLVDEFGRSKWKGANDYKSMAADNTSAFNCRYVVGREPHVLSPHASGRSIDINPWENPYISPRGVYPHRAYLRRSVKHPAVIRSGGAVRRIMARHGCSWLGYSDSQHFDCWSSWRRKAAAASLQPYPRIKPGGKYAWGME